MIYKKKKIIIFLVVVLLVGGPLLIHCFFKIETNKEFWVAEWSAGEILSYYGSILVFSSTVILSVLSLWQNEMIRNESNKHSALLEEMEKNKYCPYFRMTCIKEGYKHSNMEIEFCNISDNIALNITLTEMDKSFNSRGNFETFHDTLKSNESIKLALNNGCLESKSILQLKIDCSNIYGNRMVFHVKGEYRHEREVFEFNVFKVNEAEVVFL